MNFIHKLIMTGVGDFVYIYGNNRKDDIIYFNYFFKYVFMNEENYTQK